MCFVLFCFQLSKSLFGYKIQETEPFYPKGAKGKRCGKPGQGPTGTPSFPQQPPKGNSEEAKVMFLSY